MVRDVILMLALAAGVLVLAGLPAAVGAASLVTGGFVGILTYLAQRAAGATAGLGGWAWRAAAGTGLACAALLGLAGWLGPASVLVLAAAAAAITVYLAQLLLRRPCP